MFQLCFHTLCRHLIVANNITFKVICVIKLQLYLMKKSSGGLCYDLWNWVCIRLWERCVSSLISVCVCVCGLYCSAYCEVAQCALRSGQTPPELKSFRSLAGFQAAPRDAGQCFRQGDTHPVPSPTPFPPLSSPPLSAPTSTTHSRLY